MGKFFQGSITYLPLTTRPLSLTGTAETFDFGLDSPISNAQIRQQQTEIAYQHQPNATKQRGGLHVLPSIASPRPVVPLQSVFRECHPTSTSSASTSQTCPSATRLDQPLSSLQCAKAWPADNMSLQRQWVQPSETVWKGTAHATRKMGHRDHCRRPCSAFVQDVRSRSLTPIQPASLVSNSQGFLTVGNRK